MDKNGGKRRDKNGVRRPIYQVWDAMIQRCTNPNNVNYKRYGERGIDVCKDWRSFDNFYKDMGDPPEGKQIDRADNDKGYSKENCRWATPKENMRNKSSNHVLTFDGESMCLEAWAERTGQKANTILTRIRRGWSVGEALLLVNREPKNKLSKKERAARERSCLNCGKTFLPRLQQLRNGQGKFCSNKCSLEHTNIVTYRWGKDGLIQ